MKKELCVYCGSKADTLVVIKENGKVMESYYLCQWCDKQEVEAIENE